MRTYAKTSLLVSIILILGISFGFAQAPVNDLCSNAIDISNGSWFPGNTLNSTLTCADFRLGNCSTPQQSTNMCCGSSGVEGTIWYTFTSPSAGPATLEFGASTCNPVNFFGITTTIQGFLLTNNNCADPTVAQAVACFNPATAAGFTTPFTAVSGQTYYVQVDTKKNTLTTCTCDAASSATCHSSCDFQVRVIFPIATPISDFQTNTRNNFVNIKWLYDWKDLYSKFHLVRKNIFTKDSVVISSMAIGDYKQEDNYFTYNDYSLKTNGTYNYSLYASIDKGGLKLVGSESISVNFAQETRLNIVPNPSSDNIKLMLTNTSGNSYHYTICNALGQSVKSGNTEQSANTETSINIADLSPGIYLAKVTLEDRVLQQ
ncbi:MAG TPA: T9SS type A sorting domain-containing protein, partial [Bacteroidia bacterium]|nr:T9SS type A sorting domain-containing protein [Bacteroidia bacterium]